MVRRPVPETDYDPDQHAAGQPVRIPSLAPNSLEPDHGYAEAHTPPQTVH